MHNNRKHLLSICILALIVLFPRSVHGFVPDRSYHEKQGDIVWEVPTRMKVVALTFDDGPDPVYTPEILDILKKNHAKATFFLIGNRIKRYPKLVERETAEGHELGNHTFTHKRLSQMSRTQFINQTDKTQNLIQSYQLSQVKLLRPPGGTLSKNAIDLAREGKFEIVLWSWHQDTRDWANPGVNRIVQHIQSNVRNGDIILMHDAGGDRSQTVHALNIILPQLTKRGYRFVTITQLMRTNPKYQALFYKDFRLLPKINKK
jgi:polysaccharide deacetylase family sporulation protein PdaB